MQAPSGNAQRESILELDSAFAHNFFDDFNLQWDIAADKEECSRTLFAQGTIAVAAVAQEWSAMRAAIGAGVDVERFVTQAVAMHGGVA